MTVIKVNHFAHAISYMHKLSTLICKCQQIYATYIHIIFTPLCQFLAILKLTTSEIESIAWECCRT